MQTACTDTYKTTAQGQEAEAILRSCVHCGFCNATCPTYQLLGDELDGPRGRIYLIKQIVEGQAVSAKTRLHLDRCLTCRACETTCPSGVRYGKLLDTGREYVERLAPRPPHQRFVRLALRTLLPYPARFTPLLRIAQGLRPLFPPRLRRKIPAYRRTPAWPAPRHPRKVIIAQGCVQQSTAPAIDVAAARVLDNLGVSALRAGDGCCGALSHHLSAPDQALSFMRRNIDAWWSAIEAGAEAILSTASGCGVMIKDYGHLLAHDPDYAVKAQRVAAMTKDIGEFLEAEDLSSLRRSDARIAFHSPCTLQHGQRLNGVIEDLLRRVGFHLCAVPDAHLCCGSAGTYSLLQSELSTQLLDNKLAALTHDAPTLIATANIGCLLHLQSRSSVPVIHWIELLL